jgi:hypothetical protein
MIIFFFITEYKIHALYYQLSQTHDDSLMTTQSYKKEYLRFSTCTVLCSGLQVCLKYLVIKRLSHETWQRLDVTTSQPPDFMET